MGCEEGSGPAVTTGRGVGTGTAASARRAECAGTVALTFQQLFIVGDGKDKDNAKPHPREIV